MVIMSRSLSVCFCVLSLLGSQNLLLEEKIALKKPLREVTMAVKKALLEEDLAIKLSLREEDLAIKYSYRI